ncbi:hypothetical protein ACLX1H_000263 [Fusarium chlamydosporum]
MTTNIYDTPEFFAEYSSFEKSKKGLQYAAEWPQLRALLPNPSGMKVLDIGCGVGWFSRWAIEAKAKSVRAIDGSENMLNKAREMTDADNIDYEQANLDVIEFKQEEKATFDLAFSDLVLHYIINLEGLVKQIHHALVPGGSFVFCTEHPIFTAPLNAEPVTDKKVGRRYWPVKGYQQEGVRQTDWLMKGFQKQHRTLASYVNILLKSGFDITGLDEGYLSNDKASELHGWYGGLDVPKYLMISAAKK